MVSRMPATWSIDLIPANRRLSDAAARLQVMQLSQYNAVGDSDRASERVMSELLEHPAAGHSATLIEYSMGRSKTWNVSP